ncbi:hypothetical protein SDC9_68126 [bioreactor metagenome]|uniref:Uncharacterized protein n=1 Tax=bioreactor metagenome TaxID=1076179 RepID=A0A644Y1A5_9ZZZZ
MFIARKSVHALLDHPQSLLECLFKTSPDGHDFAYRFHGGAYFTADTVKFCQVPARDFANYIVQCRLKECRCFFCYRIFKFGKAVPQPQFCGNEGQGVAGSFGSQCRGAAQAGVHFNHAVIFGERVKSILNVAFAHNADVADDTDREFTKLVIFAVGKRLRRGHHDAFPGVYAQRIKVFHVTNRDAVVVPVAYHFILNLLPSF